MTTLYCRRKIIPAVGALMAVVFLMPQKGSVDTRYGYDRSQASENIILFVTQNRVLVYDSDAGGFLSYDLPLGEYVVAQRIESDVTVVVTLKRAIGYAFGNEFNEFAFSTGENFRSISEAGGFISVTTSERVLLFHAPGTEWTVAPLPLEDQGP